LIAPPLCFGAMVVFLSLETIFFPSPKSRAVAERMRNYFPLLLMFAVVALVVGAMIFLSTLLGPRKPSKTKNSPFECGFQPFQLPTDRFYIRFYLIAMLFILFDIEVVFLFPWAVVFKSLGLPGFVSILIFILVLGVGYVYAWRKGAFQWE
jgi:NADH-quinone oxidoreductase subunit A